MKIWRVPYPKFGDGPGQDRVRVVAGLLGVELARFGETGAVIVGSNGKGSTAAMCAALLQQTRRSVGLFTSPHLFALNERFRIDGEDISDAELHTHWTRVAAAIEVAQLADQVGGFEFLFLIAADWFAARGCVHTVWEAGLGGRLDPVKLIEAGNVALTALDFEHMELLGRSLEEIAREKISAAPQGATLHVAEPAAHTRAIIEAHCSELGVVATFVSPDASAGAEPPMPGEHQRTNAALALSLARAIAPLDDADVRAGFAATRWPGRLEVLQREPLIVIDVGHTPRAIAAALAGFETMRGGRQAVLVCGASVDKDARGLVAALAPRFTHIICAAAQHKGAPGTQIAAAASEGNPKAEIVLAESVADARHLAMARAGASGAIYVAGGLFLAAEFRAVHLGRDPAHLCFF